MRLDWPRDEAVREVEMEVNKNNKDVEKEEEK